MARTSSGGELYLSSFSSQILKPLQVGEHRRRLLCAKRKDRFLKVKVASQGFRLLHIVSLDYLLGCLWSS